MKNLYVLTILLLLLIPITNALFFDRNYFLMTGVNGSVSGNVSINCASGYALQTYNNGVETCISVNGSVTNLTNYTTYTYVNSLGNWSGNYTNYFNKTELNSSGFVGLICSNGQIAEWQSGVWICGTDSQGISAIYSGDSYTYITGGDTVNVNITQFENVLGNWSGNYSSIYEYINSMGNWSANSTSYARLDGTNQPFTGNITAPNICYSNGTNCNTSSGGVTIQQVADNLGNWSANASSYARLDGTNQPFTGNITAPNISIDTSARFINTEIGMCFNGTDYIFGNYTGVNGC
jgi:hypothetical protein